MSKRERKLSVIIAFVATIAISLLIAVIIIGVKLNAGQDICTSPECVKAAADVLRSMDTNVKPCEDFYKFSCGGWLKRHPIPPTSSFWRQSSVVAEGLSMKIKEILESKTLDDDPVPLKYAKIYYATCLKQSDESEKLRATVSTLLGDIENVLRQKGLGGKLGELKREVSGNYLVSFAVQLDEQNTLNHSIYLDEPSLGLNRAFLIGPADNNNTRAYRELIEDVWNWMYPSESGKSAAEKIVTFEKKIAKIMTAPEDRRNKTFLYNPMQLKELNIIFDEVGGNQTLLNWEDYISSLFSKAGIPENLPQLRIIVRSPDYFSKLAKILKDNATDLEIYLKWRVMLSLVGYVGKPLEDIVFNYSRKTMGLQNQEKRSKTCADSANKYFGMAISYQYVRQDFSPDFLIQINTMVEDLRESFLKILDKADWIGTENTRNKAKAKALAMKQFIGYPEWLNNKSALIEYYKNLTEPITTDSHYQNYQKISNWRIADHLRQLIELKDPNRWLVDPAVVNAVYYSSMNSISFPAGILQPPFYFPGKMIQSMNYGAIGVVMGHEITHGFDDRGRQNDEDGNLINWWDKKTLQNYLDKAECFVKQYSKYEGEGLIENGRPVNLNGRKTLGENIADNGGVRQAFQAYKSYVDKNGAEKRLPGLDNYTPEQLFFLSFAQIWCGSYTPERLFTQIKTGAHSPHPFRVKGVLQNSVEFANTWGCSAPDKETRCQIW